MLQTNHIFIDENYYHSFFIKKKKQKNNYYHQSTEVLTGIDFRDHYLS